jgi:hypothetical protein
MKRPKKKAGVQKSGGRPGQATGSKGLASEGGVGATGGSRGTAGTGGAAYTNRGGSTGGQEKKRRRKLGAR